MIKKEQFQLLKPLENEIHTVVNCGFVRGMTSRKRQELNHAYKEILGVEPQGVIGGCPHCCISALRRLAPLYQEYYDRYYNKKSN